MYWDYGLPSLAQFGIQHNQLLRTCAKLFQQGAAAQAVQVVRLDAATQLGLFLRKSYTSILTTLKIKGAENACTATVYRGAVCFHHAGPACFGWECPCREEKIRISELSTEGWETFAKPVALGREAMLLFQNWQGSGYCWRLDWKTGMATTLKLEESFPGVYDGHVSLHTAVVTKKGLWLIGRTQILLVRPDESQVVQGAFNDDEPPAVGLSDGSILVLGNRESAETLPRMARISVMEPHAGPLVFKIENKGGAEIWDNGSSERKVKEEKWKGLYSRRISCVGIPNCKNEEEWIALYYQLNHAVINLGDDRILIVGGGPENTYAAILNPTNGQVQHIPDIPHGQRYAVTARLANERIVVAGINGSHKFSAYVYDPKKNAWFALPPLSIATYYQPSIALMPDSTIVIGGRLLSRHVVTLSPDSRTPSGFANSWRLYGTLPSDQIKGAVQVLANGEIILAGGHRPGFRERGMVEMHRLARQGTADFASFGLNMSTPAIAAQGKRVFMAGGQFASKSASNIAEIIELATGKVIQTEPVPFAIPIGDVIQLDDDRVLVKASPGNVWRSADAAARSGALALYSFSTGRWSKVLDTLELANSRLVGVRHNKALFFAPDASMHVVSLVDYQIKRLPNVMHKWQDGTVRWLADGRIVVAGGRVSDGSWRYMMGPSLTQRYKIFQPTIADLSSTQGEWIQSRSSQGLGISAVIDATGRVITLGYASTDSFSPPVLEMSDPQGKSWQTLPLPDRLTKKAGDKMLCGYSASECSLLLVPDPRDTTRELLFLRTGLTPGGVSRETVNVWWFDFIAKRWQSVLEIRNVFEEREVPHDLPAPFSGSDGRMRSLGWHLQTPILWMERP